MCQPRTQETDTPIHGTLAERRCTVLRDSYGNNGGKAKNRTTLSVIILEKMWEMAYSRIRPVFPGENAAEYETHAVRRLTGSA